MWYWTQARALAHGDPWSAWYSYDAARYLLVPVDYLTSPNLDKLNQEQEQIDPSPQRSFPLSLTQGDRTWKVDMVILDPSLRQPDLGVVYESTGVTDPAAQRTEATSVLSLLLKQQPGLRANFHGLWAIAVTNGKRTADYGIADGADSLKTGTRDRVEQGPRQQDYHSRVING